MFEIIIFRAIFKHAWWAAYKKVNEDFAAQTIFALRKSTQTDPNQVSFLISMEGRNLQI